MPASFTRAVRSLEADGFRRSIFGLLLVAILLGAWAVWFLRAHVTRYEVSNEARLEVDQAASLLQATASGRTVACHRPVPGSPGTIRTRCAPSGPVSRTVQPRVP